MSCFPFTGVYLALQISVLVLSSRFAMVLTNNSHKFICVNPNIYKGKK